MAKGPLELTLELAPRARFDVVELRSRLPIEYHDALKPYPYCLYWSLHTTAGFLDRSLIARLGPEGGPEAQGQVKCARQAVAGLGPRRPRRAFKTRSAPQVHCG